MDKKSNYVKYQHLEKLGNIETEGILDGMCYVFPKLDGSNGQVWFEDGQIRAGSRNRELSLDNDNAGFLEWVLAQESFAELFLNYNYSHIRLFGEWLVPHALKTYSDDAWRKFYVFDVIDTLSGKYLKYDEYKGILEKFGIDYIPCMVGVNRPSEERIASFLEDNKYLIKEGQGFGEGIVIKNYEFVNRYGRVCWAKLVRNDFKDAHMKQNLRVVKEKSMVEEKIVEEFITKVLVDKEFSKISVEMGGWSSKYIPRLLNTVFYCLVKEECWEFVKKFKNPTINFRYLRVCCDRRLKELRPDIF